MLDAPGARFSRKQLLPGLLDPAGQWRKHSQTGDDNSAHVRLLSRFPSADGDPHREPYPDPHSVQL
jgi:hypothetical protein